MRKDTMTSVLKKVVLNKLRNYTGNSLRVLTITN